MKFGKGTRSKLGDPTQTSNHPQLRIILIQISTRYSANSTDPTLLTWQDDPKMIPVPIELRHVPRDHNYEQNAKVESLSYVRARHLSGQDENGIVKLSCKEFLSNKIKCKVLSLTSPTQATAL